MRTADVSGKCPACHAAVNETLSEEERLVSLGKLVEPVGWWPVSIDLKCGTCLADIEFLVIYEAQYDIPHRLVPTQFRQRETIN